MMTKYIRNEEHYSKVLKSLTDVKRELWIATSDIKDIYMRDGIPLLGKLAELIERGVCVRLIHAKEPGVNFRNDFDRYPILATMLERLLCPRVHFKLMIFDLSVAYIGSANLTGAGLGAKSPNRRNFDAGILTSNSALVHSAINQFDSLWMGAACVNCGRKRYCSDGVDSVV